jgi:hypothetical protein
MIVRKRVCFVYSCTSSCAGVAATVRTTAIARTMATARTTAIKKVRQNKEDREDGEDECCNGYCFGEGQI